MFRKGLMTTAALAALLAMPINEPSAQTPRRAVGASLNPVLDPIRARFELPALAAAVVKNGKPMLAGPNRDNPEVIGPAGTAHLSVLDFATWAAWSR